MPDKIKRSLLLVEDEAILAMTEKMQLEKYGYIVKTVSTGEQAVEFLRNSAGIELVLMDINLGSGIDGTQAAEIILREHDIPIVFVSSHSEREIVEKTEKITSYGYVVKNSSITVLDASIKMAFKLFDASRNIHKKQMDLLEANKEMSRINERLQKSESSLIKSEAAVRNKLKAILEPEGLADGLELSDIIDSQAIQSLMDDFYQLTGILGAILDIKGNILVASGWQDICTKFHRCNPISSQHCRESDVSLSSGVKEGTFKLYRCKNNMWDMVTPLVIDNYHVGNIFIGQFIFDDENIDYELYRRQAREYGFDEEEYLEALRRVPVFSRKTVETGISFYAGVAKMISSLSYSSVKLARTIADKQNAEDKIRKLLREKELLLTEIHHRVKNNMNIISGLLSLQAGSLDDPSAVAALQDASNRVMGISLLYDKMHQSGEYEEMSIEKYLSALIGEIMATFPDSGRIRVEKNIQDIKLDVKRLQSLGVLVNELITNCMKYAFIHKEEGQISISAISNGGRIKIAVQDDGKGIPDSVSFENSTGFGLRLVQLLAEQMNAVLRLERGKGSKITLDFPV